MPNFSTTQASSASDTTGAPIPLSYGYVWATGKRLEYYMMENTDSSHEDFSRVGIWQLGHGEWDGCTELWINDELVWRGNVPGTPPPFFSGQTWLQALDGGEDFVFNFHSGCDAIVGSGFTPVSSGPDQGLDVLWAQFPSAINPLHYSRVAYYAILRKQQIQNQVNTHQNDPTQWTDINPVGLWRALKCRLFDANGNMTGYAFTTNPAWHFVDLMLRRKLFPEYILDLTLGPDDPPAAVKARFDWNKIYTSAQYCDEFLANGRRRFAGSYSFVQQSTLQACVEQILKVCRGFNTSYAGKIAFNCDMVRPSVFTFSRAHILPGSFDASDEIPHTAANRYIAQFRDLLVPAIMAGQNPNAIVSITATSNGRPVVTMEQPHPFNAGDFIAIGGTNTTYDGEWQVYSVPDVANVGTPEEIDPTTFVMDRKGSNYPAAVGAGGLVGLLYSRFASRYPEFWHKNNMMARGAVGVGIPRQRNRLKNTIDLATSTYDQDSRIARYERDRALGLDVAPYVLPPFPRVRTSMYARDISGNLACAIEPGDHVTIDDTASFTYAGEYEVLDPKTFYPPTTSVSSDGGSLVRTPDASSGELEFALGPYNPAVFYDTSDPTQAGWLSVPGSDPGNDDNYTSIPLADGGIFVFFTGLSGSGTQFQLPSSGFPPANMLAWASAAGTIVQFHSAHTIQLCDASATRQLTLQYSDESITWGGDVGYAALTWLDSSVAIQTIGAIRWVVLTLLGGEKIAFGQGIIADGTVLNDASMPAGFSFDPRFAMAFMHDQAPNGNIMFLAGATVDSGGVVRFNVSDDSGHARHGNVNVLIFAFQNNMGSFTIEIVDGAVWAVCTLSNGAKFGVGCSKGLNNGASFGIPAAAGAATSLQAIVGSSDGNYESGSNHAQGIGGCYLDGNNNVVIFFQDGPTVGADTWYGQADVFGLYCESGTGAPTLVSVAPASASISVATSQQFISTVSGNPNPGVIWKVDGIVGGNLIVGTIDASGLYNAPNFAGTHTITATSVADPTASGSATVTVWGTSPPDTLNYLGTGGSYIDTSGNPIVVE